MVCRYETEKAPSTAFDEECDAKQRNKARKSRHTLSIDGNNVGAILSASKLDHRKRKRFELDHQGELKFGSRNFMPKQRFKLEYSDSEDEVRSSDEEPLSTKQRISEYQEDSDH